MSFSVVSSLTFRGKEGRAGKRSESNEEMPALSSNADEFTTVLQRGWDRWEMWRSSLCIDLSRIKYL